MIEVISMTCRVCMGSRRAIVFPHRDFAGLSVLILLFDPGVGLRQSLAEGNARLPVQDSLNHGVVTVAAPDPLGSSQIIFALELYAANFFRNVDELVDRNELVGTEIDGCCEQIL